MRVDALVIEIVEIFAEGVTVIRLHDGQRTALRQLAAKGVERGRELVFSQVFEEITGKGEIDRTVVQEIKVGNAAYLMLDPRRQVAGKALPGIDRNAAASDNGVDEIAIPGTQVQYTIIRPDHCAEAVAPQALPCHVAAVVRDQSGAMIVD